MPAAEGGGPPDRHPLPPGVAAARSDASPKRGLSFDAVTGLADAVGRVAAAGHDLPDCQRAVGPKELAGHVATPRIIDGRHVPLRAQTIAEMAQDQTRGEVIGTHDEEPVPVHHGIGWGKPTLMRDIPGSKNVFSHGGASGTRLWIDPDAGLVFVFFTNRWSSERSAETEAIRGTYEALRP